MGKGRGSNLTCQPPSLWAGRGRSSCERCWTRSCISRGPAVSGGCCRRTFRRSQPCRAISTIGETTACLRRSILRCCCKRARPRVAKRAQRPGSSTVNRSRRPRAAGRVGMMRSRKGRKRHIVTDTGGLLVGAEVHPADVQDRDGAKLVIEAIHQSFPWLRHLFADSVYNGPSLHQTLTKFGNWTIEIVKRTADAAGFQLLPRRCGVERTLAWLKRKRRPAKDFEATIGRAKAWVYIASVQLLVRRLGCV